MFKYLRRQHIGLLGVCECLFCDTSKIKIRILVVPTAKVELGLEQNGLFDKPNKI